METKTVTKVILVEPTRDNINMIFEKIRKFTAEKGYRIAEDLALPTNFFKVEKTPVFKSKSQSKVVRDYLTRLDRRVSMSQANKFLHMLFVKVLSTETAPRIEYSERETKIKASRKAWKKLHLEAEKLLKEYKELKGDFYKKK